MSKVLVDRELLDRIVRDDEGAASFADFEELKRVLAQPAVAEGVIQCPASHPAECYALGTHVVHASLVHGIVRQADELNAALSAVTAERDRLRASKLYWVAPAGSGLVRCVTDERYRKFSPSIRAKYDPVCCVDTAMAAKEA